MERSHWVAFAGILLLVSALFNLLNGFVAIFNHGYYSAVYSEGNRLLIFNYTAWGWIWVAIGLVMALARAWRTRGLQAGTADGCLSGRVLPRRSDDLPSGLPILVSVHDVGVRAGHLRPAGRAAARARRARVANAGPRTTLALRLTSFRSNRPQTTGLHDCVQSHLALCWGPEQTWHALRTRFVQVAGDSPGSPGRCCMPVGPAAARWGDLHMPVGRNTEVARGKLGRPWVTDAVEDYRRPENLPAPPGPAARPAARTAARPTAAPAHGCRCSSRTGRAPWSDARHSYSLAPVHDVIRTWCTRLAAAPAVDAFLAGMPVHSSDDRHPVTPRNVAPGGAIHPAGLSTASLHAASPTLNASPRTTAGAPSAS